MADRPSSRGGGVRPSSRAGGAGVRPGTGMMRPGTGARAGMQSRMGTAMRQGSVNTSGVGLNTSMKFVDRPTTQQGLSGVRPGTSAQGPARKVQDQTYFVQLLRGKQSEVSKEIARLEEEVKQAARDNAAYNALEKKYEQLTGDMRGLQGKLADYNLLLDRQRARREPHEVARECEALRQANAAETQRVDGVFNHRVALEAQARSVDEQLHLQHKQMEQRLESVEPALRGAFLQAQAEHRRLTAEELPKAQAELHFFDERVAEMEAAVGRDPARQQAQRLRDELRNLEQSHAELSRELDGPQLSEAEQRELLLARVKADNAEIAEAEKALAQLQDGLRKGRAKLSQLRTDAAPADDPKAQKYYELVARDKEMSELIGTFDAKKMEEQRKVAEAQSEIVRLLRALSRKQDLVTNASGLSAAKMREMRDDLNFKRTQADHSAATSSRLETELEQRKAELEKIHTLDAKIAAELAQLTDKVDAMRSEMGGFRDTDALRAETAARRDELREADARASEAAKRHKGRALESKQQFDGLHARLTQDDVAQGLDELEGKMRTYEQTIYQLSEFIETKGSETMFEVVADDCLKVMGMINQETVAVLAEAPTWVPQYNGNGT
mmetsp:Transcript_24129/g.70388  ORF Transcript_24129/g.70388 Transcript_24129/m.70388 type:complete len:613 (-) Transcript_24129:207-2045(-)